LKAPTTPLGAGAGVPPDALLVGRPNEHATRGRLRRALALPARNACQRANTGRLLPTRAQEGPMYIGLGTLLLIIIILILVL
jgi:hypothetical protein